MDMKFKHTKTSLSFVTSFLLILSLSPGVFSQSGCDVADIAFVVDSSESILPQYWILVKDFLKALVQELTIGPDAVQIGIIQYSSNAEMPTFYLSTYPDKAGILSAIDALENIGSQTNTAAGLDLLVSHMFVRSNGDRFIAQNIAVVLTDGKANVRADEVESSARAAKARGIRMIAVGVTEEVDTSELQLIASSPDDVIAVANFEQLMSRMNDVLTQTCIVISTPEPLCDVQADIALVLDESGSIVFQDRNNWYVEMLNFAASIVNAFPIGADKTRIAVVKFSNAVTVEIELDSYFNAGALEDAVRSIVHVGGETNIADALRITRQDVFRESAGDRPDVRDFIIFVTDGRANINIFETERQAQILRDQGVEIFAVGITEDIDQQELNNIASDPDFEHVFQVSDFDALNQNNELRDRLIESVCFTTTTSTTTTTTTTTTPTTTTTTPTTTTTTPTTTTTTPTTTTTTPTTTTTTPTTTTTTPTTTTTTPTTTTTTPTTTTTTPTTTTTTPTTTTTDDAVNPPFSTTTTTQTTTTTTPTTTTTTPTTTTTTPTTTTTTPTTTTTTPTTTTTTPTTTTTTPTTTTTTSGPSTLAPLMCRQSSDVVFVLDKSGNMRESNFNLMLGFVNDVIDGLDLERGRSRVGVMTYSESTTREFNLNMYDTRADAQAAVSMIQRATTSATNTARALEFLRTSMYNAEFGGRGGVPDIAVLITDGDSTDRDATLTQAMLAKEQGIHLIAIGVGNWLDEYEIDTMASFPSTINAIYVDEFSQLSNMAPMLQDYLCDNDNECDPNPCEGGATCHNEIGYYWCECPPGASGPNCQYPCDMRGDVVFALDASGSIGKDNFKKLLQFAMETATNLDIDHPDTGTRLGMMTFANEAKLEFDLNTYRNKIDVLNALEVFYTEGTTNTAEALHEICTGMFTTLRGDRSNADNFIVVFTDGRSDNKTRTWEEAMNCRRGGANILVVAIGANVLNLELQSMASEPVEENVFRPNDFDSLSAALVDSLRTSLCNNDQECFNDPCKNGGTCVDLINGYRCKCPPDYSGPNCTRACGHQLDLAFALDASGSIRNERWPDILDFVAQTVSQFEFDELDDRTRLALVSWSDDAFLHFHFNDFLNKQNAIQAVKSVPFQGGRTHTPSALRLLIDDVFQPQNGDRDLVPDFVVIVTDGNSNINERDTLPFASELRAAGVEVIVIPVGENFANMPEINGIASEPISDMVIGVNRFDELPDIIMDIVEAVCNDVDECESDPCQNGATCENYWNRFSCRCRSGFTGILCERECSIAQTDMVLVLDLSGSTQHDYEMVTYFALNLTYGLNMEFRRTLLGVVTFATTASNKFFLDTYSTKEEIINAMRFEHSGGRTNIYDALRLVNDEQFISSRGDRNGVRNIAVIVSDGYANEQVDLTENEAQRVKDRGAEVYMVAIGESPNLVDINKFSSDPDSDYVFRLRNIDEAEEAANRLLDHLCR